MAATEAGVASNSTRLVRRHMAAGTLAAVEVASITHHPVSGCFGSIAVVRFGGNPLNAVVNGQAPFLLRPTDTAPDLPTG